MNDFRKRFFITISGCHFGTTPSEDNLRNNVIGLDVLEEFILTANTLTLYTCLSISNDEKRLKFCNGVPDLNKRMLVFYKIKPCTLTEENIILIIQIASISGSPITALYHSLYNVYSPLVKQDKTNVNHSAIQRQLVNLQAGLRNVVLTPGANIDLLQVDADTLSIILSIDHEVDYWNNVANSAKGKERLAGAAFRDALQPLARDFSVLDALPLTDIEDLLENAHNVLDDLWRLEPSYPKLRMQHLMDLIGNDVIKCVIKNLTGVNVWTKEFNEISELLQQCISVISCYESTCKQLTQIFWPNYSLHTWSGDYYVPQNLMNLLNRLKEILHVRTVHKQLIRLLTAPEENDLNMQDMFKPFEEVDILDYGPSTDRSWKVANKKFEFLLQPAEERVAAKLKNQLSTFNTNTRQLLYEFERYSELISRPVVKQTLQNERQHLLTLLNDYLNQIQSQLTSDSSFVSLKYDTPQIISEITLIRQLEAKATSVKIISAKLLDDLQGNEDLNNSVIVLIKEIKERHNDLFESWSSETTAKIKEKALSLQETDPVVEFSVNKMMKVNYSPQLVTLVHEVRQLSALGYRITTNIKETSDHAKRFMKYANTLEQIANFHNTIGDRMIPSQRPMMLVSALELSKLVQEQEVVSWKDVQSVETYVNSLKIAVERLSKENNLLASYHMQIIEKIQTLEDTDLIKYYQRWKETTKNVRDIILQVEQKGFKSMQAWKKDLDQHLSRVLELQYLKSLDALHLYLPEIHADLIYRGSQLQFLPNKENLHEKYRQQLKKFLDIPKHFKGISDYTDKNKFADIVERNPDQLEKVNVHTEKLMKELDSVIKHWESWLTLGTLDLSQITTYEHWDLHFRASKTFGQEIAKLPSTEERVGCFIIGLSWLRSDLESHNRSYWSQLVSSLKDSIATDVFKLQQYVDASTATLNKNPLTLEQIGETGESHSNIVNQKPQMEELFQEMIRKSQMLASWTRERVDSVNRLQTAWERLQSLLNNYEHIIAKQMETMKVTLKTTNENLQNDIERFMVKWQQVKAAAHGVQISENSLEKLQKRIEDIKEKRQQFDEMSDRKEKLVANFAQFNMEIPEFSVFEDLKNDFKREEEMWILFEEFYEEFQKLAGEEWIVFRKKSYRLDEFLKNWQEKLEKSDSTPITTRIMQEIYNYQAAVPVLKYVRGEEFTDKHWMELFTMLDMTPKAIDMLYLNDFLEVCDSLIEHSQQLQILCKKAASEIIVRQALAELDQWDMQCRFILTSHTDSHNKNLMLIKDFKEILSKVGDHQSLLQSVKNSADYESFSERAELWETRLTDLDEYLTLLMQIQRKWIYLEPIFGDGTLGNEKGRFGRLDKDFRYLLAYIEREPRVMALCRYPNLRFVLENLQDQLYRCQHSLDKFLAEKRDKFPRFLFLGDDDLLEVIGQSAKEQVIQNHLKKLFAGIHSINLDSNGNNIVAICSLQGEVVMLNKDVNINRPVEDWLNVLVKEMQSTLKKLLLQCQADAENADPLKYPSQVLCLTDNITFTTKCEQAITNMTLPKLLANYKAQLSHYSSLEFNEHNDRSLSLNSINDSDLLELKLKALLLDTIHHIAVIEKLIETNVVKVGDWDWQKQLRYYSETSGNVIIKMVNATMDYSFEYLGNPVKLVRTPLTDKCFLTLTQGMHLGMGGNLYGPAGTGKTESVKALGLLLGRQVLVFNCDEGIDAASMGRILSGLVRCGAWGCFDEFNRLDEATLSAVSMFIQPIQNALRMKIDIVSLLDRDVQVNRHCGIFITLNPAGGSYGGRNKLPDSLKQLFRPVVMTHPDHEQIATTLLHCDGYKNVDLIGNKLIEMFSCASKLLSKQQHYDWGLRSLRTVLNSCNQNIRNFRKNSTPSNDLTLETELKLVVESLRTDTLSKLTYADSIKFNSLIRDIFPGILSEVNGHDALIVALKESCAELDLKVNERQIIKCRELYEQLKLRTGVAIVGPPSSGKSTLRKLLFNALIKTGYTLKQHIFNPKSMPRNQLLGQIDLDTREWNHGILTSHSLQVAAEPLDVWSWIVCDGDIDPEWVESLNSVLDDNKLLSLPSGWRIQFGPNANFIFETHSLSFASPATVSRLGIVFLSEEDINLNDFVDVFISKQPETLQGVMSHYVHDYFYKGVDWIMKEGELVAPSSKIAVASTGLSQLCGVRDKAQFVVGFINGLSGYLTSADKELFNQKVFEWTEEMQPPNSRYYCYNKNVGVIDSYTNNRNTVTIDVLRSDLPLIMTAQVYHAIDCLETWLQPNNERHFLLIGPHGSAKTLILRHLMNERSDTEMVTIFCNGHLTPRHIIHKLAQSCITVSSNKGRIFKPKKGHLVLHLKNLELLKCDRWGTNMLIEFLQQLVCYNGLFDSNLDWIAIENVTLVCTLSSVTDLSVRFISSVHVFNIDLPNLEELNIIFTSYLSLLMKESLNINWASNKTVKLIETLITLYKEIKEYYSSIREQHYDITPHDLTKLCKSILKYKIEINTDAEQLPEVLLYEALVLFQDRLINIDQRRKLEIILKEHFKIYRDKSRASEVSNQHFFVPEPGIASFKSTLLIKMNVKDWTNVVRKGITQYEYEGEQLDVLVIPELLYLTARVAKTLTESGGNLLLIGRSGVGRRSAVKIISALQSAKLVIPILSTQPQFNNDLKLAMQHAGVEGEDVYLLLADHILNDENTIDIVNSLLCSGEVPGLYTTPETDALVLGLKEEANRENYDGNLLDFFTERIKKKLHLIICLENNNANLTKIITNCPALYQICQILWLSEWSNETMDSIPRMLTEKANSELTNQYKIEIANGFSKIHGLTKTSSASPARFISLVKTYISIYIDKLNLISSRQQKLQAGVSKLTEAKNVVAELKMKAEKQQKKLAEKQSKANAALDMISNTMQNANTQKQEMEVLKQHTMKESTQLVKRKEEIENELSEVKPLIEAAQAAVGNIKTEALSEIRSLRAPPDIIRDILEGVLRLMGTQDTSWNSMKNFLSKRGVKEDIRFFDASRINTENRQAVERLLTNRSDSFDPKNAKRASVAAAPLAAWVTANVKYSMVLDKIKPLEKEQNKLKQNLNNAELQLEELSTGLLDVDTAVSKLKEQLSTFTKEAAEIEIDLRTAKDTLARAEGLVDKLDDEYKRWQVQLKELSDELNSLSTNCLLASAYITYLSEETEDKREGLLNEWLKIIASTGVKYTFSLEQILSSEREQLQWQSEGLSADKLSLQNAIIIFEAKMTPLLLDPTSVALNWIKTHLKQKTVETVLQNSPKFNTTLELAIRFGKVLIIEEIENVSPVLFSILKKQYVQQGERKLINVNGKLVDYHADFQLLLSCRNAHLQLPADVAAVITVVNFITTKAGLTEQLLMNAIKQENPELENRRRELLHEREKLQEKQYNLQNRLLEDLANASGDILQNKNLMMSLNETKASSSEITAALIESNEVHEKLQQEYDVFKDISLFGSSLYFAVEDFSKSNILYSLSVPAYIRLFLKSLSPLKDGDTNFVFLQRTLLQAVYAFMSRGIFKADRIKFALHLCHKMLPRQIPEKEWNLFLGQSFAANKEDVTNVPSWLPQNSIQNVMSLQSYLPNVYGALQLDNGNLWKSFMEKTDCESHLPSNVQISEFQKVLVVQALRNDRLHSAIIKCISNLTGLRHLNPEILKLASVFKETLASEPILLLTTSGTDPSSEILDMSSNKSNVNKRLEIAMGEGQESNAIAALMEAAKSGYWLILKNLHLVVSWLPILSQTLQSLELHKQFRLWLITEPHSLFNSVLAQNSLKIVYEVPHGIKSNLLRTYSSWGPSYLENLNPTGSRLFFILSCLHALLQERRKYIPQGWSKYYEFSDADFSTAIKLTVDLWQKQSTPVQWKYLIGICSDAIYGGKIENMQDLAILESYLEQYFVDEALSHRWKPLGSNTSLPTYSNFDGYIDVINHLFDRDLPSYFGLPENIDRAWERNAASDIALYLRGLYVFENKTEKFVREEWAKRLTPFMVLWKKLNQGHDFVRTAPPYFKTEESSLANFISEEYRYALWLVQHIHKCFSTLNRIIKGHVVADSNDLQLAKDLLSHNIPKVWQKLWSGPKDPSKYLKNVIQKTINITKWKTDFTAKTFLNSPINLSFMFHPETFIAAFKQDFSRKSGVMMDELILNCNWKAGQGESSIKITGILIEGALFDGYSLAPCLPNSDSTSQAPDCYISWKMKNQTLEDGIIMQIPLYYNSNREEILTYLQVTTSLKEKKKWIQSGLAFFVGY